MKRFEELLNSYIDRLPESRVREAMRYSLMAGGKRIRPLLLYTVLKGYGIDETKGDAYASALEMIHTYSLIHDDLPAMDNDDLRRGRPTCHKQFDEATAILAGDGLLTYAFEIASEDTENASAALACTHILALMAGAGGMVLGQDLDMSEVSGTTDFEAVRKVHRYKTGCLLSAPLMMASVIAGHSEDTEKWHQLGEKLGLAFQIQDDVMDVNELFIVKVPDDAARETVMEAVGAYLEDKTNAFDGYGTNQFGLLSDAILTEKGDYIFFGVSEEAPEWEAEFLSCIN